MLCASHLINRLPSAALQNRVPFEILSEHVTFPSFNKLPTHIVGYVAYVHLYKNQRFKLDARSLKCVFVGYRSHQKGYKCYHPPSQRFYVTIDVTFSEDMYYFSPTVSPSEEEKHVFYEDQFGELEDCVIVDSNHVEKDLRPVID